MARIRTIKPEFWTDEKLTECSVSARLLFIGLLNFADDYGNLERSSKRIKMQVFPADNFDVEPFLDDLMTHGLLTEYSVNGRNYFHINGFRKHQVINRPSRPIHPMPDSLSTHGELREYSHSEKEKEKEKERRKPPIQERNSRPVNEVIDGETGEIYSDIPDGEEFGYEEVSQYIDNLARRVAA